MLRFQLCSFNIVSKRFETGIVVKSIMITIVFFGLAATVRAQRDTPKVTAPPEAFFERFKDNDRAVARAFYKKHIDASGLSIAAAGVVADEALERTFEIVTRMLAGRPDVFNAMQKTGTRL